MNAASPESDDARRRPPLVSMLARHNRTVELVLAVIVLGVMVVIGGFTALGLAVAAARGGVSGDGTWVASAGLAVGLLIGGLGVRHGRRRNRPMMPWALLGAVVWLAPTIWLLARLSG